jgi:hypothetical protein
VDVRGRPRRANDDTDAAWNAHDADRWIMRDTRTGDSIDLPALLRQLGLA